MGVDAAPYSPAAGQAPQRICVLPAIGLVLKYLRFLRIMSSEQDHSGKERIIIVSNRLPVQMQRKDGEIQWKSSAGGLATGLGSVYGAGENLWIGWPGAQVAADEQASVTARLSEKNLRPVFLTPEEIELYYEGFSNETLWPLFHYFPSYVSFHPRQFETYWHVNEKFARAVLEVVRPGDMVWVHDYQLLLLPQFLRQARPDITVGFFLHIPFPSYELFRALPWRKILLNGLMGADLIGFHTYDDVRHFTSAVTRLLGYPASGNTIAAGEHKIWVDAFPISIDYEAYHAMAEDKATRRVVRQLKNKLQEGKLMLSIDRLDYSKGIIQRLQAYQIFLERHPEQHGKVSLLQLVVPSRDRVPKYKELKEEIDQLVGDINGAYGKLGWTPIQHFYRSFPIRLLSALYRLADVALVTPLRDGMNLVCKEYVASKTGRHPTGVLVLSEMAGAARELKEAIIINPTDIWQLADAMQQALTMPEDAQEDRMTAMQQTISRYDIHNWVRNFLDALRRSHLRQSPLPEMLPDSRHTRQLIADFKAAKNRVLFLDYDGTLAGFQPLPEAALPDATLLSLLAQLSADSRTRLVIISGRDRVTLQQWLGHLNADLIAEHGAWRRLAGKGWEPAPHLNGGWKEGMRPLMQSFTNRTPGSLIEEKSYSLAWHYRNADEGLGALRAAELEEDAGPLMAGNDLHLLQGNKVVEIKNAGVHKGSAARQLLAAGDYDFILAVGDDFTDEDTFRAMPETAYTIKVGQPPSAARFQIKGVEQVRALLQSLLQD